MVSATEGGNRWATSFAILAAMVCAVSPSSFACCSLGSGCWVPTHPSFPPASLLSLMPRGEGVMARRRSNTSTHWHSRRMCRASECGRNVKRKWTTNDIAMANPTNQPTNQPTKKPTTPIYKMNEHIWEARSKSSNATPLCVTRYRASIVINAPRGGYHGWPCVVVDRLWSPQR